MNSTPMMVEPTEQSNQSKAFMRGWKKYGPAFGYNLTGNLLNSSTIVKRYWCWLRVIVVGPTMSNDSRSQGLENRIRPLLDGRKTHGFYGPHVLQFSVKFFASLKDIGTLCH